MKANSKLIKKFQNELNRVCKMQCQAVRQFSKSIMEFRLICMGMAYTHVIDTLKNSQKSITEQEAREMLIKIANELYDSI